jgi:cell division protease FtsH
MNKKTGDNKNKNDKNNKDNKQNYPIRRRFSIFNLIIVFILIYMLTRIFFQRNSREEITYSQFRDSLENNRIESVILTEKKIRGYFVTDEDTLHAKADSAAEEAPDISNIPLFGSKKTDKPGFTVVRVEDDQLIPDLEAHDVTYKAKEESNWWSNALIWILPFVFLFLIWGMMFRRMGSGAGGGQSILNIGQSKAKQYIKTEKNNVTFRDVAGVDEAKEELSEMIEFLKNPKKFTRLGGKLPKGVILIGPPGTGKTLLARAVAGEADVPFFSLTGSEFVEMFVGVGAARVRDLFKQAKSKAPCIVFIDEIDAIGKSRGQALQISSNEERENTLNQLLAEMDGFDPGDAMIIMASTNRPEVLDRALLRPGRFDRQVLVDRPDLNGRKDILEVHTRNIVLDEEVDLKKVASQTPGFSGADLANICNEAALLASRKQKQKVNLEDFQEAIERIIAGLEKKNRLINPKEKKIVAYHESGHALVGYFTEGADPVHKVSIVPRGIGALGYTLQTPLEDRFLMTKSELMGKIKGLLGGRTAEDLIFGEISTGAANDLERVAKIAREMVTVYGMSDNLPNLSLKKNGQNQLLGDDSLLNKRSESVEKMVDDEVMNIIRTCYDDTKKMLKERKDKLEELAQNLIEKEVLQEEDVKTILGEA